MIHDALLKALMQSQSDDTDRRLTCQVHLRLLPGDTECLRQLAKDRDQTISATVRFLLRRYLRARSHFEEAPERNGRSRS